MFDPIADGQLIRDELTRMEAAVAALADQGILQDPYLEGAESTLALADQAHRAGYYAEALELMCIVVTHIRGATGKVIGTDELKRLAEDWHPNALVLVASAPISMRSRAPAPAQRPNGTSPVVLALLIPIIPIVIFWVTSGTVLPILPVALVLYIVIRIARGR